jgi:hypothetical protein
MALSIICKMWIHKACTNLSQDQFEKHYDDRDQIFICSSCKLLSEDLETGSLNREGTYTPISFDWVYMRKVILLIRFSIPALKIFLFISIQEGSTVHEWLLPLLHIKWKTKQQYYTIVAQAKFTPPDTQTEFWFLMIMNHGRIVALRGKVWFHKIV